MTQSLPKSALAVFATLFLSYAALGQTQPHAPVRDPQLIDRAYIASAAYHAIKRYFAHAEALPSGFDFETQYRAYLAEALPAADRRTFSLATMKFFAALHNGHTGFDDDRLWEESVPLPFRVLRVQGQWTVTTSRLSALVPGDVIQTVDGVAVDRWLAPVRERLGASSDAALYRRSWSVPFLLPSSFTLGLTDGRRVKIDQRSASQGMTANASAPASTQLVRRADGVLIVRVRSFETSAFEDGAVAAIRAAQSTTPVLFDLRGNGGGSTPEKLLAAIMTKPYRGTMVATPLTVADSDARANISATLAALPTMMMRYGPDTTPPAPGAWNGPVAVLTDGGCSSACEDFVLRFKDGHRGLVLGEQTNGSTGQPFFVNFPEFAMSFRVSTKREYFPDGHQFEGVGVTPDVTIQRTIAELKHGTDDQLEQAVGRLLAGTRPLSH